MKKNITLLILFLFSNCLHAATISWGTMSNPVSAGDAFTLDIIGTDFFTNVDGGGVEISFDAAVLSVLSVTIDETVWDFDVGVRPGTINNVSGTIEGIMVNAFSAVTGDFTVASIEFQVLKEGSSLLSITEFGLNPFASAGSVINPQFSSTTFETTVVPVPAAVWLFGSGLIGLIGFARRKKA